MRAHRGFIRPTALAIALLGAGLSLTIFSLAQYMQKTDERTRGAYSDQINVAGYIEEAKGFIVTENNRRSNDLGADGGVVLHGRGADATTARDYFYIRSMSDLQVCTPAHVADALSRDIPIKGKRTVRLQVFDANYRVGNIRGFTPESNFPPSIIPAKQFKDGGGGSDWEQSGDADSTNTQTEGDVKALSYYKNFGAYLVRAEVFEEGKTKPLRRTEELFYMLIPAR